MDKYEILMRIEEIRRLYHLKEYKKALKIIDTIDISKRRMITELNMFGDVYAQTGRYEEARNTLLRIYEKSNSRRVLARLIELSIKREDIDEARDFFEDYLEVVGNDPIQYLYEYKINLMMKKDVDILIQNLEKFLEDEYDEKWGLELAKLYHKADDSDKCIEECSKIILWFGDGIFVDQAKMLRSHYTGETVNIAKPFMTRENSLKDKNELVTDGDIETQDSKQAEDKLEENNQDMYNEDAYNGNLCNTEEINKDSMHDDLANHQDDEIDDILSNEVNQVLNVFEEIALSSEDDLENQSNDTKETIEVDDFDLLWSTFSGNNQLEDIDRNSVAEEKSDLGEIDDNKKNENQLITTLQDKISFLKNLTKSKKKEKKINIQDKIQDMINAAHEISSESLNQESVSFSTDENIKVSTDTEYRQYTKQEKTVLQELSIEEQVALGLTDVNEQQQLDIVEQENIMEQVDTKSQDNVTLIEDEETKNEDYDTIIENDEINEFGETLFCGNIKDDDNKQVLVNIVNKDEEKSYTDFNSAQLTEKSKTPNILSDDDIILDTVNISKIFRNFITVCTIKDDIMLSLDNIRNQVDGGYNIVITGSKQSGKTEISKMFSKVLYKLQKLDTPKLAKINANKLNQIDLLKKKLNLLDGCVIIEQAGDLSENSTANLITMLDEFGFRISIILEDSKEQIDHLFLHNKELKKYFANNIHLPEYNAKDLIGFAHNYLAKIQYEIDQEVSDRIYNIANNIYNECPKEGRLMAILECIDYAKAKCDIRNRDNLKKIVSSGKYEESELCNLKAIDFTE